MNIKVPGKLYENVFIVYQITIFAKIQIVLVSNYILQEITHLEKYLVNRTKI